VPDDHITTIAAQVDGGELQAARHVHGKVVIDL
jgi:hypothetical protein